MSTSPPSLCVITAGRNKFRFLESMLVSLRRTAPAAAVIYVDDASDHMPDFGLGVWPDSSLQLSSPTHVGPTACWNLGLRYARDLGSPYVCISNNDVLFTQGWWEPLQHALDCGYHLCGPVSNAPGHAPRQKVTAHLDGAFGLTDDRSYLDGVAAALRRRNGANTCLPVTRVNGFCFAATLTTFWAHSYDAENVFSTLPRYVTSRQEDELQARMVKRGCRAGVCIGSFVFHYRGVTRAGGTRGVEGRGWYRPGGST